MVSKITKKNGNQFKIQNWQNIAQSKEVYHYPYMLAKQKSLVPKYYTVKHMIQQ